MEFLGLPPSVMVARREAHQELDWARSVWQPRGCNFCCKVSCYLLLHVTSKWEWTHNDLYFWSKAWWHHFDCCWWESCCL